MSLEEYAHLWDGSETGWKLQHFHQMEWQLTFCFSSHGPTLAEISKLRELLDEFRDSTVSEVWNSLRGRASYALSQTLSNLEMRRIVDKAEQMNLKVSVDAMDGSGYLPMNSAGSVMIIEDDTIADEVARRMIQAGVEVQEIEVD
jgi:hypothetical protein